MILLYRETVFKKRSYYSIDYKSFGARIYATDFTSIASANNIVKNLNVPFCSLYEFGIQVVDYYIKIKDTPYIIQNSWDKQEDAEIVCKALNNYGGKIFEVIPEIIIDHKINEFMPLEMNLPKTI